MKETVEFELWVDDSMEERVIGPRKIALKRIARCVAEYSDTDGGCRGIKVYEVVRIEVEL